MTEYMVSFEAISHLSLEDLSSEFYGRFDGVLVERMGRIAVSVYEESDSGIDAAMALIEQLEAIGFSIKRVDPDLVDAAEVATRLGVTRQAVSLWAKGSRGDSFPHPVGFPSGKRIWAWGQITEWAHESGKAFDEPTVPALSLDEAALVDAYLARRRIGVGGHAGVPLGWTLGPASSKGHKGDRHVWVDAGAYNTERSIHPPNQTVDR